MPTYDMKCNVCDDLIEVICKIAEKEEIKECPACGATDFDWIISAPMYATRSDRLMTHKKDQGFQEVLAKVGERNKRTEIAKR